MHSIWDDITEEEVQWKYLDRTGESCEFRIWEDGDIEVDPRFDHEFIITNFGEFQRVCEISLAFCMEKGNDLV